MLAFIAQRAQAPNAAFTLNRVALGAFFAISCALLVGFLSVVAAFGLFVICAGALALDAVKRISAWQPIDRADWLGDLLYVPEGLYCIALTVVILGCPGPWSLDAIIAAMLAS